MNAIWLIGRQSLQFLFKDKIGFIWFLIVPVAYIVIFGSAFQGGYDSSIQKASLSVLNQDTGLYSERLMHSLQSENLDLDTLTVRPEEHPARMLVIPDTFSVSIEASRKVDLFYSKNPSANSQAAMTARLAIQKACLRLLADIAQLRLSSVKVSAAAFQRLDDRESLITVRTENAGRHETIPSGFNQQVPAQIVQFSTLMLFIYAGSAVLEEKQKGLLRRMKTTPIHFMQLFLGKLLFVLLLGLAQSFLILSIGRFVFHVYLGASLPALILIIFTFVLAVGSMGLCLGFMVNNPEKMLGFAIITGLLLSALSGCWWPIEIAPGWMQNIAAVLPTGMALKALHMLISFGKGFSDILPYAAGLAATALLFSALMGRFLLKYQEA